MNRADNATALLPETCVGCARNDACGHIRLMMGSEPCELRREVGSSTRPLPDSGERRQFPTGAVRDRSRGKGRFDLIEPELLFRLARHYEAGAIKYDDRNWEKGIPISCFVDSAFRHLTKYLQGGCADEDHLAAVLWNVGCIMRFEHDKRTDLLDLPWQQTLLHEEAEGQSCSKPT